MSMGDEEDRKLFVGGLPQDTTQDELKVPVTFRLVFESGFRGVLDLDPGSLFNRLIFMGKFYIYEIIQCCGAGAEIIFLIKVFRLHNTEIILYQFLAGLRNSLDLDPDSGVFWIRIRF